MNRFGVWAVACVIAPSVFAAAGNIPGHGEGGPGDQETEQLGGLRFYVGGTYDWVQLHIANSPLDHYNMQFAEFRFGYRLFKSIGVELHAGAPTQGADGIPGRARLNHDVGFFVVPTTVVFDTVELSFPLGYNVLGATAVNPGPTGPTTAKGDVDSFSFGANLEFPIRVIDGGLPDLRVVAGGMMLSTHGAQQIYGFRAGLRYDFSLGNTPPPASTPATEGENAAPGESSGSTPPAEGAAAPASGASAGAAAPASGSSAGAAAPASGSSAGASTPASGSSAGAAAPASSAGAATPASGGSSGASAPASGASSGAAASGSAPASSSSSAPASSSSTGAAKPVH